MSHRMYVLLALGLVVGCGKTEVTVPEPPAPPEHSVALRPATVNNHLRRLVRDADQSTDFEDGASIQYFTGISHDLGFIPVGRRTQENLKPGDAKFLHEFHYNEQNRLTHVVANREGDRFLTQRLTYDKHGKVVLNFQFRPEGPSFADAAHFDGDELYMHVRFRPSGEPMRKIYLRSKSDAAKPTTATKNEQKTATQDAR